MHLQLFHVSYHPAALCRPVTPCFFLHGLYLAFIIQRTARGDKVLSLSKTGRQNQANSHRLIWASSFRKEDTAARSHPTYPMGRSTWCHQLETVQACWSCSTMGLMHFPSTLVQERDVFHPGRTGSKKLGHEQKRGRKRKLSGIIGIIHRVAWQILTIAFWSILGAASWTVTSPEWYQEWWNVTCSVSNLSHQRRESTAKGLQPVENHTFPWRHRAILQALKSHLSLFAYSVER